MVDDDDGSTDETLQQPPATTLDGRAPKRPRTDPAVAATAVVDSGVGTNPVGGARSRDISISNAGDGSRYRLGELLGRGGMGEVVVAFDDQIGREVAIKRIRSDDPSAEELARFVREARVQGRLEHPAVVPVHDLAVDRDGKPFFVMKRVQGTVMSALLRDGADDAVVRRRLLRAFADVCLAIELAHSKGVIHRDLKPSNVMLGDFGEVYVLDWGIARAVTEPDDSGTIARPSQRDLKLDTGDTQAGTVLGTLGYMAPEQLAGERAGPAADIYALGCILYEIVAGHPLHRDHRPLSSVAMPTVDSRPSAANTDAPPELDAICVASTQLDPAARPSARKLGEAIQAFLDGDRDVAMRRDLAIAQIAEARTAIARGNDEANRRLAMRAAGRALALDPTATEAAELVTTLVLRPPNEMPAEVEAVLEKVDTEMARSQGRFAALSLFGYLGFVPLLLWTGVRDTGFVVAFAALALASAFQVYRLTHRDRITSGGIYFNACINALLIGLICRMVGPFIIAPTLVATTLMGYAAHPRFGRISIIAMILASSVLVPWGLELVGAVAPTYKFVDGTLVLDSPIVSFHSAPVQIAFAVLLVALLAVVAVLSRMMAERQREASRRFELQAWHLRQLVPPPEAAEPKAA